MPKSGLGSLSDGHRELLRLLYQGSSLSRDDLPYTEEFDRLHREFQEQSGRSLTAHDFWRAISSLGKTGGLSRKQC